MIWGILLLFPSSVYWYTAFLFGILICTTEKKVGHGVNDMKKFMVINGKKIHFCEFFQNLSQCASQKNLWNFRKLRFVMFFAAYIDMHH